MLNVESHPASLIPIGGAGTKTYYKDNTLTMVIIDYYGEFIVMLTIVNSRTNSRSISEEIS